jgi:hypothetical protein
MGSVNEALGLRGPAPSLLERASDLRRRCLGYGQSAVARSLNHLTRLLRRRYDSDSTDPVVLEALEPYDNSLPPGDPDPHEKAKR